MPSNARPRTIGSLHRLEIAVGNVGARCPAVLSLAKALPSHDRNVVLVRPDDLVRQRRDLDAGQRPHLLQQVQVFGLLAGVLGLALFRRHPAEVARRPGDFRVDDAARIEAAIGELRAEQRPDQHAGGEQQHEGETDLRHDDPAPEPRARTGGLRRAGKDAEDIGAQRLERGRHADEHADANGQQDGEQEDASVERYVKRNRRQAEAAEAGEPAACMPRTP